VKGSRRVESRLAERGSPEMRAVLRVSLMGAAIHLTEVCIAYHVRFRKWKRYWYISNKLVCIMFIID